MSEITDKTDELFMAASRSDDDLGYPADVAFVPSDEGETSLCANHALMAAPAIGVG